MTAYLLDSLAWSAVWFVAGYMAAWVRVEYRDHNKSGGKR